MYVIMMEFLHVTRFLGDACRAIFVAGYAQVMARVNEAAHENEPRLSLCLSCHVDDR